MRAPQDSKINFRRARECGFGLVETMVVASIIGVMALAVAALLAMLSKGQNGFSTTVQLYQLKQRVMLVFLKDLSWQSTILKNEPITSTHFNALRFTNVSPPILTDPIDPAPWPFFILNEGQTTDWYNSTAGNSGFTMYGAACSTFGNASPALRDACPFRYTFTWTPVCPGGVLPPLCFAPTAQITATFSVSPGMIPININPVQYGFTIVAGTPLVDLQRNCSRLGGVWNFGTNACDYNQQYCNSDPTAPYFRGWTTGGTPLCAHKCTDPTLPHLVGWQADNVTAICTGCTNPNRPIYKGYDAVTSSPICDPVIKVGNATQNDGAMRCGRNQVVRGVASDGSMICGLPLNQDGSGTNVWDVKCSDSQRKVGAWGDGTPICEDLIPNALAGSSGVHACNAPQKQTGVYQDGTVRCENLMNSGGQTSCGANEHFVSIDANGNVNCAANTPPTLSCYNKIVTVRFGNPDGSDGACTYGEVKHKDQFCDDTSRDFVQNAWIQNVDPTYARDPGFTVHMNGHVDSWGTCWKEFGYQSSGLNFDMTLICCHYN